MVAFDYIAEHDAQQQYAARITRAERRAAYGVVAAPRRAVSATLGHALRNAGDALTRLGRRLDPPGGAYPYRAPDGALQQRRAG